MLCRIQPRRWPAVLLGLGEMLVAGGGNLSAEFVRVEGGFQNFVLRRVGIEVYEVVYCERMILLYNI